MEALKEEEELVAIFSLQDLGRCQRDAVLLLLLHLLDGEHVAREKNVLERVVALRS